MCGTLLVDLHPQRPSSSQACLNIIRCSLSAAGLAALQPVIDAVGIGWCYTAFAGICTLAIPLCIAEQRYGREWRLAREAVM